LKGFMRMNNLSQFGSMTLKSSKTDRLKLNRNTKGDLNLKQPGEKNL
jgi:hypothetical protein